MCSPYLKVCSAGRPVSGGGASAGTSTGHIHMGAEPDLAKDLHPLWSSLCIAANDLHPPSPFGHSRACAATEAGCAAHGEQFVVAHQTSTTWPETVGNV